MKKSEALHKLIHSLSANEKRFFKIYASRHTIGEQNNYVKLFSLFDSQKTYNEQQINKLAKSSDFINYFAAEKNYLYNLILDCLDIYHKETSVDRQISKLINTGRVLMEKKLDEQADKILRKAKNLSELHCRHESLIAINNLLIRKSFATEIINDDSLEQFHLANKTASDAIQSKLHFQTCYQKLLFLRRKHGIISNKQKKGELVKEYPHLAAAVNTNHFNFDTTVYYLTSILEFHRIFRNHEKGREIARLLIDYLEENKSKITDEFIDRYSYALYCFLVMRLYKNIEEANKALDKLHYLENYIDSKITKQENARCFEFHFTALTDIYIETKEYHKIIEALPEFDRAFKLYEPHMTPSFILALHFNIACIFFSLGEYKEALAWANKVRNTTTPLRKDLFYDLRTLNMIIHLELGNLEILPSLIKSAAYHHKKGQPNVLLQKSIMQSMKECLKAKSKSDMTNIFIRLRDKLLELRENPLENRIFNDLDLIAWVNKRVVTG